MPQKKTYRKKAKKAYKKMAPRRAKTNTDLVLIKNPNIGGFPKSMFTTLKYVQAGSLNPGVGGTNAIQVFRANDIYDPDYTGAGHQPRGFDQWMTLYDHFYVKRSKITIEYHNGDATYEVQVGVAMRDDYPTEADPIDYAEQDGGSRLLGRVSSSKNATKIVKYFNFSKQNYAKYVCEQNKGGLTSGPTEVSYFHCWAGQPWGSDSSNCYYTVSIEYQVLFTELKALASS